MSGDAKRLSRLATTQRDVGRLLECRFASEQKVMRDLERVRVETLAALDRIAACGLAHYAAALQRLAELDARLSACRKRTDGLQQKLREARGRERALSEMADSQTEAEQRRQIEEEGLEAALRVGRRATRK